MESTKLPAEESNAAPQPLSEPSHKNEIKKENKKRSRLARELGSLRDDNAKKARRDWPKCPICGVPVEPAQFENHHRLELYELQQLNFRDFEQAKSRGKRGAAVQAKRQLEKTTGKRKVASRYEDCLEKIKKNRDNRSAAIQGINAGNMWNNDQESSSPYNSFDTGLQQTCFICNQVLSGDTESINLHIDGCLAQMNFEGGQEEITSPSHDEATAQGQSSADGEAAEALSAAEWEEYEWAGQRRVRATAMLEGGYGGVGMSTTVKGEDVEDDLDVEDDDADQFGEAQYSERDIVVNQDDDNEDSAALREMVSGTTISRKNTLTQNTTALPGQRPGYEATVSDDGWKQHLLKDTAIPADAAGHTKLVIESLRAQITQLERASRSVPKCLICLEPYKIPLASVVCWHVHCEECWLHSMGTKKLCPQCQKIVTPADLRRIYLWSSSTIFQSPATLTLTNCSATHSNISTEMAESVSDFVAGWVGGAAGILVGSPLDVLKARLQAPRNEIPGTTNNPPPALTATQTMRNLVQREGFSSLFKGVLSPIVGLAGLNAILFVSYGSILRYLNRSNPVSSDPDNLCVYPPSLSQVFIAGCGAGIACFLLSTPTDLVKIQAQMYRGHRSTMQVAKDIFRRGGITGFFQGGMITITRDAPSYGVYFAAYEGIKRSLKVGDGDATGENAWKLLLAGGLAGTISWASIYPLDVIKSRMQMQIVQPQHESSSHSYQAVQQQVRNYSSTSTATTSTVNPLTSANMPYRSTWDCIVRSYKTEGLRVFVRGIGPTVLRAFPVNAVTFWVYEVVAAAMNNMQK